MGHAVQWYSETWAPCHSHMEVQHPGVHVPPADEAGGIVTRTTTRMRLVWRKKNELCEMRHTSALRG